MAPGGPSPRPVDPIAVGDNAEVLGCLGVLIPEQGAATGRGLGDSVVLTGTLWQWGLGPWGHSGGNHGLHAPTPRIGIALTPGKGFRVLLPTTLTGDLVRPPLWKSTVIKEHQCSRSMGLQLWTLYLPGLVKCPCLGDKPEVTLAGR
jgi:hypothetical protein